jgi:hypothetical protein
MSARIRLTVLALTGLLASSQASALTSFAMLDAEHVVGKTPGDQTTGSQGSGLSLHSMRLSDGRATFFVNWADLTSNAISVSIHSPANLGETVPAVWFELWSGEHERRATSGHSSGD